MQVDPMSFTEFLLANGDENLANYLETINTIEPIPDAFFNPPYEKLKMYYVTGGMPESVKMWTESQDIDAMQEALYGIIGAYERDFAKHPDISDISQDLYDLEVHTIPISKKKQKVYLQGCQRRIARP